MEDSLSTPPLPSILVQRRIEATFLRPFLAAWESELGPERTRDLVRRVVADLGYAQGRALRERSPRGLEGLVHAWKGFAAGGALDVRILEQTDTRLRLRVTRCRYAELYRELGLERWGAVLSCGRDGPFAEGLCPEATLTRSTPLMEGGPHCDFLYTKADE